MTEWSCELEFWTAKQVFAFPLPDGGAVSKAFSITLPVLKNTRALGKKEAVVLKWGASVTPQKIEAPQTWVTDAQKGQKRKAAG